MLQLELKGSLNLHRVGEKKQELPCLSWPQGNLKYFIAIKEMKIGSDQIMGREIKKDNNKKSLMIQLFLFSAFESSCVKY